MAFINRRGAKTQRKNVHEELESNRSDPSPTATDKFYPDFVARLNDNRLLVVEYKGFMLMNTLDAREKRTIGELWEQKSEDKGLFAMVTKKDERGNDMHQQIWLKIGN